jgi:alanine racemase
MLDVTDCPELELGSVVTLLGCEADEEISPVDWAARCGTIPWEILCGFKHRLPRLPAESPPAKSSPAESVPAESPTA